MFADPQTLTIGATSNSVSRTGMSLGQGTFQTPDGSGKLTITQKVGRRNRTEIRAKLSKTAADPLVTGNNQVYEATAYVVLDRPASGFSVAELTALVTGLFGNLTASTNANLIKAIGLES